MVKWAEIMLIHHFYGQGLIILFFPVCKNSGYCFYEKRVYFVFFRLTDMVLKQSRDFGKKSRKDIYIFRSDTA